ncbi:HD domain-containing protein [Bacillus carboniphilus]|uniref:HD domain-containing protein n=1 Tax=Bacillus carboniphilus TaxID=86663 RepID=A0ABN0W9X5_9BACI
MLLENAKRFAMEAHAGQLRKSTGTPMIEHPIRVAETLREFGFNEEVVAAGFLHDTVEDTDVTIEDIEQEFGEEVARIVAGNTENKEHSWEERKQHTIDWVKQAPIEIKALIVADKLDNLNSLMEAYKTQGDGVWRHFKRGKEKQGWYFSGVALNSTYGLGEEEIPDFFKEFIEKVNRFWS